MPTFSCVPLLPAEVFDEHWRAAPKTLLVPYKAQGVVLYRNITFLTLLSASASGTFEGMNW
jgi:hypothetical protein